MADRQRAARRQGAGNGAVDAGRGAWRLGGVMRGLHGANGLGCYGLALVLDLGKGLASGFERGLLAGEVLPATNN